MAGTNIVFPECIICLSPLQSDLVIPVNCGHVFHEDCLRNWHNKGNNDNCPICKRDSSHSIKLIYEIKYCSEDEIKEEPKTLTELLMRNRSLKSRNESLEKEIKELTEYNNKCQKTVEDFIKQVDKLEAALQALSYGLSPGVLKCDDKIKTPCLVEILKEAYKTFEESNK